MIAEALAADAFIFAAGICAGAVFQVFRFFAVHNCSTYYVYCACADYTKISREVQFDDVFVVEDVGVVDVLAGIGVVAPDFCKFEFVSEALVDNAG